MSNEQVKKGMELIRELEALRSENKDLRDRVQKATEFVRRLGYEGGCFLSSDSSEFRPIKSEEDTAVDEIMKSFYSLHTPTDIASAIYRAGYRKRWDDA